jgi:hypothetical protein
MLLYTTVKVRKGNGHAGEGIPKGQLCFLNPLSVTNLVPGELELTPSRKALLLLNDLYSSFKGFAS